MIALAHIGREDLRPAVESCGTESSGAKPTGNFHVAVTITSDRDETTIEVLFVTPDLFGSITGIAVLPTERSGGYDGRLLP